MQTSAMKACFQIAESSFSAAKIRCFFVTTKFFEKKTTQNTDFFRFQPAFASYHKWQIVLSVTNRESSVTNRNFSVTKIESSTSHWRN